MVSGKLAQEIMAARFWIKDEAPYLKYAFPSSQITSVVVTKYAYALL